MTPAGGLAGHVDAIKFLPHVPQTQYPAGALAAALYLVSGVRSMERGTISMDRDADGNDVLSDLELCRMAVPRRVYSMATWTMSPTGWAGSWSIATWWAACKFYEEPPVLRFFTGRLGDGRLEQQAGRRLPASSATRYSDRSAYSVGVGERHFLVPEFSCFVEIDHGGGFLLGVVELQHLDALVDPVRKNWADRRLIRGLSPNST